MNLKIVITLSVVTLYFCSCQCGKGCNAVPPCVYKTASIIQLTTGELEVSTNMANAKYAWSTGAVTKTIPNPGAGTYTCTVTGDGNCNDDICTYTPAFTVSSTTCGAMVNDVDGNSYNTVSIGSQCWMKENLKTTHYNDGSEIQEVQDSAEWKNIAWDLVGAWCYYDSNASNNTSFGKLYNYYVVMNTKNVCPSGWHVPSAAEVDTLISYLGGSSVAGGKMKTVTLWSAPNTGADNSSGFSAVPSGRRNEDGEFTGINQLSDFWTATYSSPQYATSYLLSTNNASVYMNSYANKGIGSPIRCISD